MSKVERVGAAVAVQLLSLQAVEVEQILPGDLLCQYDVALASEHFARLLVDVGHHSLGGEEDDALRGEVEEGGVTLLGLLVGPLSPVHFRHVALGAQNHGGFALLVAVQHGEHHNEVPHILRPVLHVARLDAELHLRLLAPLLGRALGGSQLANGLDEGIEILGLIAVCELVHGVGVSHLPLLVAPFKQLLAHQIGPHFHAAGFQYEGEALVPPFVTLGQPARLQVVGDGIDAQYEGKEPRRGREPPHPGGDARLLPFRIEPLVAQVRQAVGGIECAVHTVQSAQQDRVVRHELVLAVRHVDGCELYVIDMILVDEPLQREGVPHHGPFAFVAHLLQRQFHRAVGYGIIAPSVVYHQMVAQAAVIHEHAVGAEVLERGNFHRFLPGGCHTLGEERDGILAVVSVGVMIAGRKTEDEVASPVAQVLKGVLLFLQLHHVRDVQLVHEQLDQLHIEAVGLAMLVEEGIGPKIPHVLIH